MEEKKILTITKTDGTKEKVEEVVSFEFNDTKKRYIVYTKNETDPAGNVTVYVNQVVTENGEAKFVGIDSDEEWDKIKEVLRKLSKEVAV